MPYRIIKSKDGYFVENTITKRRFSHHPLSHEMAKRQLAVLNHHYAHGGDFQDILDFAKSVPGRLKGLISGVRYDYQPKDREFLKKYGNCPITRLTIFRRPIPKYIDTILDFVSRGKFSELKQKMGYDKLFHLYLRVDYLCDGVEKSCKIEKNEVITITEGWKQEEDTASFTLFYHRKSLTINQLLNNTRQKVGDEKFFTYNYSNNNCQVFIMNILEANKLMALNPKAKLFVYQDVEQLSTGLDSFTNKLANFTTDTAHRVNILTAGSGFLQE